MNIPEKWAPVYEMCKEFLAHPGEPSTKPIDWCVSLIEENAQLRDDLARTQGPVSMEEMPVGTTFSQVQVNALIAARAAGKKEK